MGPATVIAGLIAGFIAGRLAWVLLRPTFALPVFKRRNVRGIDVPTACGVVLLVAAVVVEGGRTLLGAGGVGRALGQSGPRLAVLVVVFGLGLVGLLDDLAGDGDTARGFRGHLTALRHGRLTTGAVKIVVGPGVALIAVAAAHPGRLDHLGMARLLADAALVALCANLVNLLDRAPGRAGKVGLAGFVLLAIATGLSGSLSGVAVVAGAAAALLPDDLKERAMLGDTGANALGGVIGIGIVAACSPTARTVALVVVIGLNVVSELVSFSQVIERVAPLRRLDDAGRRDRDHPHGHAA